MCLFSRNGILPLPFHQPAPPDREGGASNILRLRKGDGRNTLRLKSGGGEAGKWVGLVNRGQLVADRGAATPITACSLPETHTLILADEQHFGTI